MKTFKHRCGHPVKTILDPDGKFPCAACQKIPKKIDRSLKGRIINQTKTIK